MFIANNDGVRFDFAEINGQCDWRTALEMDWRMSPWM